MSENDKPEEEKQQRHQEGDPLLELWVSQAEQGSMSFGITLQMSGLLVSGILMGQAEYFKKFASDVRDGWIRAGSSEETAEAFHDMLVEQADNHQRLIDEEAKWDEVKPFGYIHLRDVNIFLSPNGQPFRVEYWRGRLAVVDGWILGQLQEG